MSLYERKREDNGLIHFARSVTHTFPAHFHQNLEIYIIREGSYTLVLNGRAVELSGGSVAVIDSYDVHEYVGGSIGADDCVVIIPPRYLERFNRERGGRALAEHVICDPGLVEELLEVVDRYMARYQNAEIRALFLNRAR